MNGAARDRANAVRPFTQSHPAPMKSILSARLGPAAFGLALFACPLVTPLVAAPVTTWTSGAGTVTDLDTASPSFGSGSNQARASFAAHTLSEIGDSLVFSGAVTFVFPAATNGGDGSFRWGLFNANGSSNDNGWSGYLTANKLNGSVPLYEKDGGGGWNSTSNFTAVTTGITGGRSNYALSSGTYSISFTLVRVETGLSVSWSLVGQTNNYALSGSWIDTAPTTYTFDRIALQTVSNFGQTEINFANLDITYTPASVPEPSAAALGLGGAALLTGMSLRRRR